MWFDRGTHQAIKILAARTGLTMAELMTKALDEWVRAHQDVAAPRR